MKRRALVIAAVLIALPAAVAGAQGRVTGGGIVSANLEWLDHHELSAGVAEGGRLAGRTFFLTNNQQGLLALDVSQPEAPQQVGHLLLPHVLENEDVATNGRILLLSQASGAAAGSDGVVRQGNRLNVIDVRDPAEMRVLATVDGAGDHTWECLLDCTWAYSATGLILDLRDPEAPRLSPERWRDAVNPDVAPAYAHDTTEVAPGMVMVASAPMFLLDARGSITKPSVVATAPEDSGNSWHNVVWPRHMNDRFLVTANEGIHPGRCETNHDAALQVYDATGWRSSRTWEPKGTYRPVNGTHLDGQPAVSATFYYGCSAHWAETHPQWHDGGLIAGAFFAHGARLLEVGGTGEPREIGYFLAHGAATSAVYWISDRVLYAIDLNRGLDVLRYTGPLPQPPGRSTEPPAVRGGGPRAPLVDRRAPRVGVRVHRVRGGRVALAVRCDEDCYGRVRSRRFALRRNAWGRIVVRRARGMRLVVSDRAGNRRIVPVPARQRRLDR